MDTFPLVIQYPLSNTSIKYRFLQNSDKYTMSHSSEETIDNEYQFNSLVVRTDSDDRGDRFIDLKIQVKEVKLDRSCGYSVLDYGIYIQKITVLVTVAKPHKNEKAVAQTLVQIYSTAELMLGKRIQSETDSEQTMFVEISQEYTCIFKDDMKEENQVVSHIVRILQV
ncbi:1860_t:CDS:2 [Funneliformis geosporum]|uniref:1860_t:CDS:1 n=1 Tax=Funneliformis geosporum TaxID=1117311 RepID=A0A9W4SCR6_9GLOM|nr:1860_t:CDS:2 [Funneliformis geosporum]